MKDIIEIHDLYDLDKDYPIGTVLRKDSRLMIVVPYQDDCTGCILRPSRNSVVTGCSIFRCSANTRRDKEYVKLFELENL